MTDISLSTTSYQVENRSWLLSPHGTEPGTTPSITLDISGFTSGTHYPNGFIPSGTPLAKVTSSGLYIPYVNQTDESAVITRTATGGTVTFTLDGETTAATAVVAATTAAQIKTALETLSNVNVGDITVTGSAGGPFTVTFVAGDYSGIDAPNLSVDATNATGGTVTIAITAGAVESPAGEGAAAGLLFSTVKVPNLLDTTVDVGAAMLVHGFVSLSKLPFALDAAGQADLKHIIFTA